MTLQRRHVHALRRILEHVEALTKEVPEFGCDCWAEEAGLHEHEAGCYAMVQNVMDLALVVTESPAEHPAYALRRARASVDEMAAAIGARERAGKGGGDTDTGHLCHGCDLNDGRYDTRGCGAFRATLRCGERTGVKS